MDFFFIFFPIVFMDQESLIVNVIKKFLENLFIFIPNLRRILYLNYFILTLVFGFSFCLPFTWCLWLLSCRQRCLGKPGIFYLGRKVSIRYFFMYFGGVIEQKRVIAVFLGIENTSLSDSTIY